MNAYLKAAGLLTLNVLNSEFLYQRWREHTRSKSTTEDSAEFRIQASDTHVFELEIRGKDSVGWIDGRAFGGGSVL